MEWKVYNDDRLSFQNAKCNRQVLHLIDVIDG